jgi:hypothetical protein
VDTEPTGSFGYIVAAIGQYAMDVFPLGLGQCRHWDFLVGLRNFDFGSSAFESVEDVVDIGWFGQEVYGT